MRVAPPVQAWSCSAGPWASIQQALYALSAGVSAWWAGALVFGTGVYLALASLGIGLAVAALAARGLREPPRLLVWDAAVWALESAQASRQPGQVMLMLDLGAWMLVRFTPDAPGWRSRQWLAFSGRDAGASWAGLRVALYALRTAAGETGAPRPPSRAA